MHGLAADHAAVADQVGKEPNPVFGPAKSGIDWFGYMAGYGQSITEAQIL